MALVPIAAKKTSLRVQSERSERLRELTPAARRRELTPAARRRSERLGELTPAARRHAGTPEVLPEITVLKIKKERVFKMKDSDKQLSGTDLQMIYSLLPQTPSLNTENVKLNYDEKPREVSFLSLDEEQQKVMDSFMTVRPVKIDRFSRMQ